MNKLWNVYIIKCYTTHQSKEWTTDTYITTWIHLKGNTWGEGNTWNERRQTQKARWCMIPFIWYSGEEKTVVTKNRSVGSVVAKVQGGVKGADYECAWDNFQEQ